MQFIDETLTSPSSGYKKTGRCIGNIYCLPSEFQKLILQRKLYCLEAEHGVAWLHVSGRRNQFYFQTSESDLDSFMCEFDTDRGSYVSELIFNSNHPEKCASERVLLRKFGFTHFADAYNLKVSRKNVIFCNRTPSPNFTIQPVITQETPIIDKILSEALDPVTDAPPSGDDLLSGIEQGVCWKIQNNFRNDIAGCMFCEPSGHRVWIRHVVILKEYRGLGLSRQLLEGVLAPLQPDIECTLWVKADNIPALHLYSKLGFIKGKQKMEIWLRQWLN